MVLLPGRLPVVVQVAASSFVSSIVPTFPVMAGDGGMAEIIWNIC